MSGRNRKDRTEAEAAQYGFRWGPLDVTRLAEFNGSHALEISTDFGSIEVYVSKTGRSIRAFKEHVELKAAAYRVGEEADHD